MRFDPEDPIWPNRDRFVLSNGHASMLLWSVLHLTGTKAVNADYERLGQPSVSLDDIRRFRQIGSKAPGHPEYQWVSGVETTTGPLGPGAATSVGMAIAEKWLAEGLADARAANPFRFNARPIASAIPNAEIEIIPNVTHYTFLARCNLWGKVVARSLCADPDEIDREEVHRRVSADALKFFNRALQR